MLHANHRELPARRSKAHASPVTAPPIQNMDYPFLHDSDITSIISRIAVVCLPSLQRSLTRVAAPQHRTLQPPIRHPSDLFWWSRFSFWQAPYQPVPRARLDITLLLRCAIAYMPQTKTAHTHPLFINDNQYKQSKILGPAEHFSSHP
jgi:hypothetical protein